MTRNNDGNISALLEALGLYQIGVSTLNISAPDSNGMVDLDGLTEKQCYDIGLNDGQQKMPPDIESSDIFRNRIRSRTFYEAYIKGYMAAYLETCLSEIVPNYSYELDLPSE